MREGDGADLALGELPVVVVGVVGQARHLGADRRTGVGDARDGDDVQRVAGRVHPVARGPLLRALVRRAQPGEHGHRRRAVPGVDQQPGDRVGGRRILAQHQHPRARCEHATNPGERPGDRADDLDPVDGPPEPRARQRHRRGVRDDVQPVRPEHAGEGGADAVEHRVAAGQHAHPPVRQLGEQPGQGGQHRRGPRAEVGLGVPGDEVELPRPAQQHLGRPDGRAPRLGEPGPPVGADAHDGHGLHECIVSHRATIHAAPPSTQRRLLDPRAPDPRRLLTRVASSTRRSHSGSSGAASPAARAARQCSTRRGVRNPARRHEPGAVARSRAASSASSATNHSWPPRFDSRTKSRSAVLPSTLVADVADHDQPEPVVHELLRHRPRHPAAQREELRGDPRDRHRHGVRSTERRADEVESGTLTVEQRAVGGAPEHLHPADRDDHIAPDHGIPACSSPAPASSRSLHDHGDRGSIPGLGRSANGNSDGFVGAVRSDGYLEEAAVAT